MRRRLLDDGWEVRPKVHVFAELQGAAQPWAPVSLPHDAMIATERTASAGPANAFFPPSAWEYRRTLPGLGAGWDGCVVLEFEGVYRDAVVSVNGSVVARRPYGYSWFNVAIGHLLEPGDNEVRVDASAGNDSRWYSGAGIHRDVWLLESGRVHLAPEGLSVRTPQIDGGGAVVEVTVAVQNESTATSRAVLRVEILDAVGAVVGRGEAPVTVFAGASESVRRRVFVASPRRWTLDDPHLHTCRATLLDGDDVLDGDETTFGIRTLAVDAHRGLRVNDEPVLLRGACVHHDNGPLGSAAIGRADERRVELLKAAGFNAIRSAHNPMSRAMLDACDRLGILVMEEAFDMWARPKSGDDYARNFATWWEADIEAMVRNAENHPSVIFYSIGNEIPDGSTDKGLQIGRALAEKVRRLDDSRFVTQSVTGILVGGPELFADLMASMSAPAVDEETGVNTVAATLGDIMLDLMRSPVVDHKTREAFATLDVAGYNYMASRYAIDAETHPDRVVVGTETHPAAIATAWPQVLALPSVIGDFVWTGWDYLGEAGIGMSDHRERGPDASPGGFHAEFPWLTAWCGDIDITGHRRPQSYFREIVFGLRTDPYIAVLRPEHDRRPNAHHSPWSWNDVVSSWSWVGHQGQVVLVEVYAGANEVELLLDGRSLGRQPAGVDHGFRATFEVPYGSGELVAVSWDGGTEVGRSSLRSADGSVRLQVVADRTEIVADHHDLSFVELTLVDGAGIVLSGVDRYVEVAVDGPGTLQGIASANPSTDEALVASGCTTFDGRAVAVIRPTGPGTIVVSVIAEGCATQQIEIAAAPPA